MTTRYLRWRENWSYRTGDWELPFELPPYVTEETDREDIYEMIRGRSDNPWADHSDKFRGYEWQIVTEEGLTDDELRRSAKDMLDYVQRYEVAIERWKNEIARIAALLVARKAERDGNRGCIECGKSARETYIRPDEDICNECEAREHRSEDKE